MPKFSEMFTGKYLKGADLKGTEPVVTIAAIDQEDIGMDGSPDLQWVAHFVGKQKGMIIKPTNASLLKVILGVDGSEGCIGRQVKIWFDPTVMYMSKPVGGLRFKTADPGAAPQVPQRASAPPPADDGPFEPTNADVPF